MTGRIPQRIDLKMYAGDSDSFTVTVSRAGVPVDVTVGQWASQIKADGIAEPVGAFEVTLSDGQVVLFLDADTSQRLGDYRQQLRWDLQQTFDNSTVTTHAQGYLSMSPDVTRFTLDLSFWADADGTEFVGSLAGERFVV